MAWSLFYCLGERERGEIHSMEQNMNREAKSNPKLPKPPSRLQKRAPAALQLDQIAINDVNSNPNSSHCAIPLLSPLIVSPPPLLMSETQEKGLSGNDEQGCGGGDEKKGSPAVPSGGWQHPAMGTFNDASSMFSFFQSQCVL